MAYTTIFKAKPKSENKKEFCCRIISLLNEIKFCNDGYVYNDGRKMINEMFKYSILNNGYYNVDDLLNENGYNNVYDLVNQSNIKEEAIFVNIDIIANCLFSFRENVDTRFYNKTKSDETIMLIFKAFDQFLLGLGYKLLLNEEETQLFIVENDVAIDISIIEDKKMQNEVISFYNYKNQNEKDEKKKILLNIITKLESRKNDIERKFCVKIADMFSNYANNIDLRHNNIDPQYKSKFNQSIYDLSESELIEWYNYLFAFMMNIYLTIDKLKDININNGYK